MDTTSTELAILAGNSRVQIGEKGSLVIEPQIQAFDAALSVARQHKDKTGLLPRISVAFDHHGVFRLQFLRNDLTNSQKRNPRLSHLRPEIVAVFHPITTRHEISLDEIRVIHEDSARQHATHILTTKELPETVRRRMISPNLTGENQSSEAPFSNPSKSEKLTCAVITKEYFEKAADPVSGSNGILEVFFEDSAWSRDLAYVRGLQLSHLLGVEASIRLNIVGEDGVITRGELIHCHAIS